MQVVPVETLQVVWARLVQLNRSECKAYQTCHCNYIAVAAPPTCFCESLDRLALA